jgi:hypothetical protein
MQETAANPDGRRRRARWQCSIRWEPRILNVWSRKGAVLTPAKAGSRAPDSLAFHLVTRPRSDS